MKLRLIGLLPALGLCVGAWAQEPAPEPGTASGAIEVSIVGVEGAGPLHVRLFDAEEHFLDADHARASQRLEAAGGTARCRFEPLPPGTYAVTVWHDEDGDGEVDTHIFGIPSEGLGTSNNPRPRFGPPRFRDAALDVADGAVSTRIEMWY